MTDPTVPARADARRNRDAVLDAAVRVLAERPEASMREIAEASGLGRTTIYRHFRQREELVSALLRRVFLEAQALVDETVAAARAARAAGDPGAPDAVATIAALAARMLGLGARYRVLERHGDSEGERALRDAQGDEPLRSFLAEAQARGEVRDDLPVDWLLRAIEALIRTGIAAEGEPGVGDHLAASIRALLTPTAA
ncbi:TetR/AcrR family transcriptional regulator [Patulibacter defluvii]|uniref:TetR/AcrR family transcriptional regulator n=1 Tax=Patulibacter defluvii TaxID=3095358 RepID=UPI002A75879B|nr:helix-turn-helix domain-containing protein [Patulibacter sp. DM4]